MRRRVLACILALTLPVLPACTHHASAAESTKVRARSRSPRDLITIEEIESRNWSSIYDLVSTLRANWLNNRGTDTINGPVESVKVLLDGVPIGGIEQLHSQSVMGVQYLQYFDPVSASGRWGLGFGKGAILISMRRP
jgi:hypothetical protein